MMSQEIDILQERTIKVGKYNINYLKVGHGEHVVFCLPGALGSIWTDFKPQVEGFDTEKFTLFFWDPPGYGKSIPPEREFTAEYYSQDVDTAFEFMKLLNIPKFSIMGWCNGGVTGIQLAAKYPEAVIKLVVWGSRTELLQREVEFYKKIRDTRKWSEQMRQPKIELYGNEKFSKLWAQIVDTLEMMCNTKGGKILSSELLNNINCPTLILHGEQDFLIDEAHPYFLHRNIQDSRIYFYPEGKHNIHLRYSEDFNRRVQIFLTEN